MTEPESLETPDRNVYLELASGGGVLIRDASSLSTSPLLRKRRYRDKELPS